MEATEDGMIRVLDSESGNSLFRGGTINLGWESAKDGEGFASVVENLIAKALSERIIDEMDESGKIESISAAVERAVLGIPPVNKELSGECVPTVKFARVGPTLGLMPFRSHEDDTGFDLTVSENVTIPANSFADVHCGIAIEPPEGYWCRIVGRSSSLRKHGIMVAEGIVDEGYRGELFVGCWNLRGTPVAVMKGMRIAQLIFHRRVDVRFTLVEKLAGSSRGTGGFGSTGE